MKRQDVGGMGDDPTMSDLTYEQALATVLALVGERVEVHVLDAGESPHHVATFGGRLRAGYSTTGGEPTDTEAILLRFDAGEESAGLSLDRELFGGRDRPRRRLADDPARRRLVRDSEARVAARPGLSGPEPGRRLFHEERSRNATARNQEGHQARQAVRARQRERETSGPFGEPCRGDHSPHRPEGARSQRRVPSAIEDVDAGHLVRASRGPSFGASRPPWANSRSALCGRQATRHRGPLEDEQGSATAGGRGREQLTYLRGSAPAARPESRRPRNSAIIRGGDRKGPGMHNPLRSEQDVFRAVVIIGIGAGAVIALTLLTRPAVGAALLAAEMGLGIGLLWRGAQGSDARAGRGGSPRRRDLPGAGDGQRDGGRAGAPGRDPEPVQGPKQRDPRRRPGADRLAGSSTGHPTSTARSRRQARAWTSRCAGWRTRASTPAARSATTMSRTPSLEDALRDFPADEVIISTHPPEALEVAGAGGGRAGARGGPAADHPRGRGSRAEA